MQTVLYWSWYITEKLEVHMGLPEITDKKAISSYSLSCFLVILDLT